ncbi:hypothetical protein G6L37_06850 [Agrobacterium rubi]|nr:hypothetical protein [Agrobacterium rubi]NTF25083.1 hypothetical protein [Agrobacterium rubi]
MLMRVRREIGIAFTAPMIRAILEGRKTETRRLASDSGPLSKAESGDLLWAREAFTVIDWDEPGRKATISYPAEDRSGNGVVVAWPERLTMGKIGTKLPRFMPREASRASLLLLERRREPLEAIDDDAAMAEGIDLSNPLQHEQRPGGGWVPGALSNRYLDLWEHINAPRGHGRATKPLVDVFRFSRAA